MPDVLAISLLRVDADDARLARLVQLYVYDWSARLPLKLGKDGLFAYDVLGPYADRETRKAYLVIDGEAGTPLGFALALLEPGRWCVEDFFIVVGARRRGLGTLVASALFATQPGPWTLTVREENPEALLFWRRAAPGAEEEVAVGTDRVTRTRLSFVSRRQEGA